MNNKIRQLPLRKLLALWAMVLLNIVVLFCVFSNSELPVAIKDLLTYTLSITIGAYFASSSYEAVRKEKSDYRKESD
jgi:hypothetical protein